MPSLKDLANTVASFRYYSGVGNFTARDLPYGEEKPLFTTAVGFRWSPSNFDGGVVPFGAVTRLSRGAADLFRIGKWLVRDPKGPLFVLKQSILQRTNPNIEFPKEISIGNNNLGISKSFGPTRVYSPLPLIAQVVGSVVGTRFMRHGFLPQFSDTTAYEKYVYGKDKSSSGNENRLYVLYTKLSNIDSEESKGGYVLSYRGGPGSFLGIGKTVIPRYGNTLLTQPTNEKIGNYLDLWSDEYLNLDDKSDFLPLLAKLMSNKDSTQSLLKTVVQYKYPLRNGYGKGVEWIYRYGNVLLPNLEIINGFKPIPIQNLVTSTYKDSPDNAVTSFLIDPSKTDSAENTFLLGQNHDYRAYKNKLPGGSTLTTGSYESQNLESRIGISRARKSVDKSNGVVSEKEKRGTHDKVNYLSLYSSTEPIPTNTFDVNGNKVEYNPTPTGVGIRDLIKFRIKIINNDQAPNGVYIIFRSYISNIKRTVTPKWNPYNYVGRGESFYAYDGFTETISISFTIAASSRLEMKPLYQKLNYLISSLAPDYASDGKMRGNIAELTIGNFLLYQPGVITGLDMTIDEDSNWDIAIDEPDENGLDNDMYELPQLIKCNMSFIPIYNFLPKKGFQSPFIGIDKFTGVKDNQRWLRSNEVINQTLTTTP